MTDMDYRQYDNALGRFVSMDVLSEFSFNMTPYHFSYNDPISYSDPTGLCPECSANVKDPKNGSSYTVNGINYIYDGKTWVGQVEEVVVTGGGKKSSSSSNASFNLPYFSNTLSMYGVPMGTFLEPFIVPLAEGALGLVATDVAIPDPTDLAPPKWIGYAVIVVVAGSIVIYDQMSDDGDSSTDGDNEDVSSSRTGNGRGSNNRTADDEAVGDHTVRDENGHTTYKENPNNPNKNSKGKGFETDERVDYRGRSHKDKQGNDVPTPHVHKGKTIRPAVPGRDMPRRY
jgi:hypothetical protein